METVGFIGLGNMGGGMATNIQRAGYAMTVFDLREEAIQTFLENGARLGDSPAQVAALSDITFTSLPGPREVEEVPLGAEGVLEGIKPGGIYADLSASRPTLIRQIEPRFRQKVAHVLDAPVSGGKRGAASGNLAVMVGGDRENYDRIKPLLDSFGDKVLYAGAIGAGSVAKLMYSMISHGVRQAIAEGLTLGVKAGVEPEALWECVRRGAMGRMSGLHEGIPKTVFRGEFDPPSFALSLARKDIALATELGKEYNVPMPVANLGRADCHSGHEPRLGRSGQQRHLLVTGGAGRRGGTGASRGPGSSGSVYQHPPGFRMRPAGIGLEALEPPCEIGGALRRPPYLKPA